MRRLALTCLFLFIGLVFCENDDNPIDSTPDEPVNRPLPFISLKLRPFNPANLLNQNLIFQTSISLTSLTISNQSEKSGQLQQPKKKEQKNLYRNMTVYGVFLCLQRSSWITTMVFWQNLRRVITQLPFLCLNRSILRVTNW